MIIALYVEFLINCSKCTEKEERCLESEKKENFS